MASHSSFANISARASGPILAIALLSFSSAAAATEFTADWSLNFTPALIGPRDGYDLGGGIDPELKYTLDLGGARLSSGVRIGAYYAKNLFGVVAMPTARLTVPLGSFEPYTSFGVGYGWIEQNGHGDVATMSRVGFIYSFSDKFSLGLEGTFQKIEDSDFRFPSFGSVMSFTL